MPLFLVDMDFHATLQVEGRNMGEAAGRIREVRPAFPALPDGVHNLWGSSVSTGRVRRFNRTLPSELPDLPRLRRQIAEQHNTIAGLLLDAHGAGEIPAAECHPEALERVLQATVDLARQAYTLAALAEEYRQQVERWAKEK
jgi:hypothetical protein